MVQLRKETQPILLLSCYIATMGTLLRPATFLFHNDYYVKPAYTGNFSYVSLTGFKSSYSSFG